MHLRFNIFSLENPLPLSSGSAPNLQVQLGLATDLLLQAHRDALNQNIQHLYRYSFGHIGSILVGFTESSYGIFIGMTPLIPYKLKPQTSSNIPSQLGKWRYNPSKGTMSIYSSCSADLSLQQQIQCLLFILHIYLQGFLVKFISACKQSVHSQRLGDAVLTKSKQFQRPSPG